MWQAEELGGAQWKVVTEMLNEEDGAVQCCDLHSVGVQRCLTHRADGFLLLNRVETEGGGWCNLTKQLNSIIVHLVGKMFKYGWN